MKLNHLPQGVATTASPMDAAHAEQSIAPPVHDRLAAMEERMNGILSRADSIEQWMAHIRDMQITAEKRLDVMHEALRDPRLAEGSISPPPDLARGFAAGGIHR